MKKILFLIGIILCTSHQMVAMGKIALAEEEDPLSMIFLELGREIEGKSPNREVIKYHIASLYESIKDQKPVALLLAKPLVIAVENGAFDISNLLISSGAEVNIVNSSGQTIVGIIFDHWEWGDGSRDLTAEATIIKEIIFHGYLVEPDDLYLFASCSNNEYGIAALLIEALQKRINRGELADPQKIFQQALVNSVSPNSFGRDGERIVHELLLDKGAEVLNYTQERESDEFREIVYEIIGCDASGIPYDLAHMKKILARSLGRPELTRTQEQARATIVATLILMKRKGVSKDVALYILHLAQEDLIHFFAPLIMNRQCKIVPQIFIPLLHRVFYEATINELNYVIEKLVNSEEREVRDSIYEEARQHFAPEVIEDTIGQALSENIHLRLSQKLTSS